MMDFLERVTAQTLERVKDAKKTASAPDLEKACERVLPPPSFRKAVSRLPGEGMRIVAEVKRSSPSRGPIQPDLDLRELLDAYRKGGASAISVLTEPHFFGGSVSDLREARAATALPVLRKDFILDPYQILEARAAGAAAVLLIAAILNHVQLRMLLEETRRLGMYALVEVHDEEELAAALEAGAEIIGTNNRDLKTMQVDMETTRNLAPLVPRDRVLVSESGYHLRRQVERALSLGVHAILVGEVLVRAEDPRRALLELRGQEHVRS